MNVLIAQCTYQTVLLADTSAHSPVVRTLNTDRDFLIVDIPIFLAGTSTKVDVKHEINWAV